MIYQQTVSRVVVTSIVTLAVAQFTNGNEATTVQPYLADDVAGVAYLDLRKIDLSALLDQFGPLAGLPEDQLEQVTQVAAGIQLQIAQFQQHGVGPVYMLLRTGDLAHGGPTWVAPVLAGGNPQQVVALLEKLLPRNLPRQWSPLPTRFAVTDGYVLAASNTEQLTALEASRRTAAEIRSEADAAAADLESHAAALVLFGDTDSRRVIRELFPPLRPPFARIDGRLIADGIRWGGLTLDVPPHLRVQATLQLTDTAEARAVEESIDTALGIGKAILLQQLAATPDEVPSELAEVLDMLRPKVDEAQVSLTLGDDPAEVVAIGRLLAGTLRPAQQAARRNQRMNQFKQIALAFHNYEGREKSFPPAAIHDEQGRPLLSWRVAILPFLEQQCSTISFTSMSRGIARIIASSSRGCPKSMPILTRQSAGRSKATDERHSSCRPAIRPCSAEPRG